jgi:hypothetical protein
MGLNSCLPPLNRRHGAIRKAEESHGEVAPRRAEQQGTVLRHLFGTHSSTSLGSLIINLDSDDDL